MPWNWYFAAALSIGIGWFMYAMEASDVEKFRLADPVPATGFFAQAECKVLGRKVRRNTLQFTYRFVTAESPQNYTALREIEYPTMAACEADLPAVQAARTPHPVWFERNNPHSSRTTLAEPDSRRFLLVCLAAVPFALIGWAAGRRLRRQACEQ